MIENPYFLLSLLLIPLYFMWRKKKHYISHPCVNIFPKSKSMFSWKACVLLGATSLILASANISMKSKEAKTVSLAHKYVLVNDASGSMIHGGMENGVGDALKAVIAGNKKFLSLLNKREDGTKDLVSLVVFSDEGYIVSYFTEDSEFVFKKLTRIDYRLHPLNRGTNLQAALWTALNVVLTNGGISEEDASRVSMKFYGRGANIKQDGFLENIINKKKSYEGASIIVFTDGFFMAPEGSPFMMSAYKILDFCKLSGIRVYFISVDVMPPDITRLCKEGGGDTLIAKPLDISKLEKIYEGIIKSQANEHEDIEIDVDRSLSMYLGLVGLLFVFLGLMLHNTRQLNYTEV